MASKLPLIESAYYFDATPEEMFSYFTDGKKLAKWFVRKAKITPKAGSAYHLAWSGGYSHDGRVKRVVPNRLLTLTWPDVIKGKKYETQVSFSFKEKGKGTLVKLKHTGFKEGADWIWLFGAIQSGWAYFMTNLKSVVAEGVDLRSELDSP